MSNEYTKNQVFIDVDGSVIKDERTTEYSGVNDRMKQTNKLIENDQKPKEEKEPKFKFNLKNMEENIKRYKEIQGKNNVSDKDSKDKNPKDKDPER